MKNFIANLSPKTKTVSIIVFVLLLGVFITWLSVRKKTDSSFSTGKNKGDGSEKNNEPNIDQSKFPLKKGSSGAYVTLLQQHLLNAGAKLPEYGVDGQFGSETEAALFSTLKVIEVDYDLFISEILANE